MAPSGGLFSRLSGHGRHPQQASKFGHDHPDDITINSATTSTVSAETFSETHGDGWTVATVDVFNPGLGASSGKAILAIGRAELKAVNWVWIKTRKFKIGSKFPHSDDDHIDGLDDMYDDLLDFARAGIHDNGLSEWALSFLQRQVELGQTTDMRCRLEDAPVIVRLVTLCALYKRSTPSQWTHWSVFARPVWKNLVKAYNPSRPEFTHPTVQVMMAVLSIELSDERRYSNMWMELLVKLRSEDCAREIPLLVSLAYNLMDTRNDQAKSVYERLHNSMDHSAAANQDVMKAYQDLAQAITARGEYADAEHFWGRLAHLYERNLGVRNPATRKANEELADCMIKQNRYSQAIRVCQKTLELSELVLGHDHLKTMGSAHRLASCFWHTKDYAAAEIAYNRVLETGRKIIGEDDILWDITTSLAQCLERQGKYSEAEPLWEYLCGSREHKLGTHHPLTIEAHKCLEACRHRRYHPEEHGRRRSSTRGSRRGTDSTSRPATREGHVEGHVADSSVSIAPSTSGRSHRSGSDVSLWDAPVPYHHSPSSISPSLPSDSPNGDAAFTHPSNPSHWDAHMPPRRLSPHPGHLALPPSVATVPEGAVPSPETYIPHRASPGSSNSPLPLTQSQEALSSVHSVSSFERSSDSRTLEGESRRRSFGPRPMSSSSQERLPGPRAMSSASQERLPLSSPLYAPRRGSLTNSSPGLRPLPEPPGGVPTNDIPPPYC